MGLTTSLDPQWDPDEAWNLPWNELLPLVDVFLPNRSELLNLTGRESLETAVDVLRSAANVIVVKDGNQGAHLFQGHEYLYQKAYHSPSVVDSIGAGDSFNAGFIHYYIQKYPLKECLKFGALTGALNTTRSGGTGAFQSADQFRDLAASTFGYHV